MKLSTALVVAVLASGLTHAALVLAQAPAAPTPGGGPARPADAGVGADAAPEVKAALKAIEEAREATKRAREASK